MLPNTDSPSPLCTARVRSAMLHASGTWPLALNLQRLQRNDRATIRQICNVRPQDIVTTRSNELLARLDIEDLELILKERRLRWYGHVERSNGAVKTAFDIQVDGKRGPGRPKMTWKQLTGIAESGSSWLSTLIIDIPGDLVWDLPCVQQASYLEGGPLMWMLPLYSTCTLIKIQIMIRYDDDMIYWGGGYFFSPKQRISQLTGSDKTLRKHTYSNILKILPPKNENFQIKNSDIFSYFCSKQRLGVLVRTALMRQF